MLTPFLLEVLWLKKELLEKTSIGDTKTVLLKKCTGMEKTNYSLKMLLSSSGKTNSLTVPSPSKVLTTEDTS